MVLSNSGSSRSGSGSGSGSSYFDQAANDPSSLLGPDYKYQNYINTPSQMGIGPGANDFIGDVGGLVSYIELLIIGGGKASATGKPLGNQFFMKTAGKCKASDTGSQVDRYIYINNVPTGNIPLVTGATGSNMGALKGMIPGVLSNLNALNPMGILNAFTTTGESKCTNITMNTVDSYNRGGSASNYVLDDDIKAMDACIFPNGVNTLTKAKCKMAFTNLLDSEYSPDEDPDPYRKIRGYEITQLPRDPIVQMYFLALGLFAIYIMYRISGKTGK